MRAWQAMKETNMSTRATYEKLVAKMNSALEALEDNDKRMEAELGRELQWTDFCDTPEYAEWNKAFMAVEDFEKNLIRETVKKASKMAPMAYISLMATMKKSGVTLEDMMKPCYRKDVFAWALKNAR